MGPRLVWRDLGRIVQGVAAWARYLRSQEAIDIGLGAFEAASSTVVMGCPCAYAVRIANVRAEAQEVTLTLEILPHTPASPAAKPSACFAKHCTIPAKRAIEVEFNYNWHSTVTVMIDHVTSTPDECWKGEMKTLQRYVLRAILSDLSGKHLDTLEIYQELTG